mgnify:FL=1
MARRFDSLVSVLHEDVLDAQTAKTPKQIAEDLGFNRYTTFMNQLEQQEGFKLDANMILPLMRQTGSLRPLHYLADRMGCVVIELPKNVAPSLESLSMQALQAVKEMGDVMGAFRDAIADGSITSPEKAWLRRQIYEALMALMVFSQSLEVA